MSEGIAKFGVLTLGAGGLGIPAAIATLGSGVTGLSLIDPDLVELSNLARQVVYRSSDVGRPKAVVAAERLGELFPQARLEACPFALDASNAARTIARFAFVVEATDSPSVKFLVNDVCVGLGRPFVYGGVLGLAGQAMTVIPGRTACLRCLFEEPPGIEEAASCREAGIIGPVAGLVGAVQGSEAARFMMGAELRLAGRLLTYEADGPPRLRTRAVSPRAGCICQAARNAESIATERRIPEPAG